MENEKKTDALEYHARRHGKIEIALKADLKTKEDLSLAYTPGVADVSRAIAEQPDRVNDFTNRGNTVAIVTNGTAVLGLGDIGPYAALPVMEGKSAIFKAFAGVDALPICLNTKDMDAIIDMVTALEPSIAGVNLEDIAAPACFEIEKRLQERMNVPVFHDDQHGTAIVVVAGLINALRLTDRGFEKSRFVISGAGAAGTAIAEMLLHNGAHEIFVVDSKGILSTHRTDLNSAKQALAEKTNPEGRDGGLAEAVQDADVFVGVSAPGILSQDMVRSMKKDPIIFALANPIPEIMPEKAKAAGAAVIATGRSDFPNQVNNALAFPGMFRGALDVRAKRITPEMNTAAATALAELVPEPTADHILPNLFEDGLSEHVAEAVRKTVVK